MAKTQFILHYFLLNKYSYIFAAVCIFFVNWLQVEIPRYIQQAIDLLTNSEDISFDMLTDNVKAVIILSAIMVIVRILSRVYALNPGRVTEMELKNDLFYKLNRLPRSFHIQYPSGRLISIINNDLNGIRLFYGIGFLQLFNILFALSLTPFWMWQISPKLTFYSAIPILIGFVFFRIGFRHLRNLQAQRLLGLQKLSEQLMNFLLGMELIKNQQMEPWATKKINTLNQQLFLCTMQITRIQTFVIPIIDYANQVMKVVILGLGGYYLLESELSIGEITAFLSYSVLLSLPLMSLGRIVTIYQMGMVGIDSVQNILGARIPDNDLLQLPNLKKHSLKSKTLTVKNLSFRYQDNYEKNWLANLASANSLEVEPHQKKLLTLNNISFSIEPGKKLGVLGGTGAGKSTLVDCLNHYLEVEPGQIFWGSVDITEIARKDLRLFIRTITQEAYLFSETIENNVRFGSAGFSPPTSDFQVSQALGLSQLSDDILSFKDNQKTMVGEKGVMLSGGQKQRLSIARALLSPGDLVIMDNVLSAVDYETERKILKGLFHHLDGKSILVISNHISALKAMDEILVLEQGQIIARGTHSELLESSSYYYETWKVQELDSQKKESRKMLLENTNLNSRVIKE
jgi:ATP-binding cassette, subfamily B, multidrug efflux pump